MSEKTSNTATKTTDQLLADALALVKSLQEKAKKVEKGSRVSWDNKGKLATGVVLGFGNEGTEAFVETDQGGFELTLATDALTLYTETKSMSNTLKGYRAKYEPSISANGRKSLNTGDDFARLVVGASAAEVCSLADAIFEAGEGHHAARYSKLNIGQQRMNSGNRVRAAIKRGDAAFETVQAQFALIVAKRQA